MAIDPSIALGVKPVQLESPINQMAKVYEMQNAVQSNQLNKMKMDEYTRGVAEAEQFKNALAQSNDETAIRNAFYAKGDVKGYNDYLKSVAEQKKLDVEATNLGYTGQKTQVEAADKKQSMMQSMMRDLSTRPSDANLIAHAEDIEASSLFSPQEKAAVKRRMQVLLSLPMDQRVPELASQGASAGELKPTIQTQNLNDRSVVSSFPAFGGAPMQLSSTPMGISPADAQRIALDKQRVKLEGQRVALDERRTKVAETTGAPGYVKPLNATQQYKLDKLKTADKTNAKLFDASIDAELSNIDKLIGSETKPKLHKGLSNATGPIASRLPTGRTETSNAEALIESLQSKASINSLQSIRGTAGAIGTMTEREWPRLESMKATLQAKQGTDQFVQSLKDYRAELKNMKLKSKEALNTDYSTEIGANIPSANPNIDALLQKYPE
jgi:hypothetical protein